MNPEVLAATDTLAITFLASFLIWAMFGGLAVLWFIDGRFKQELALHAFFSCLFAWLTSQMIKYLFPTVRPFELNGSLPLTITIPFDGAFPSAHAATAFALATAVFLHHKRLGTVFLMLAALVAVGRVLSNVHFWGDVVGGTVLGIVCALLVERMHVFKLLGTGRKK